MASGTWKFYKIESSILKGEFYLYINIKSKLPI